ncbi:hypothetical protein METBIDRAFT_28794, partial [Metschnikowia bicuspidata var. bicuspidata NRRL YB-4993]
ILARSLDIKKQLQQSFHGHSSPMSGSGGVTKPRARRDSAYHIKTEDGDAETRNENDRNEAEEQGIERKRRDNINDKIQELLELIPGAYFQDTSVDAGMAPGHPFDEALALAKSTGTRDGKPNKGQILTQAVEYIQFLQNVIDENNRKEVELCLRMQSLHLLRSGGLNPPSDVPMAVGPTSAEQALGEIGVGPESDAYFRAVLLESHGGIKS